MLGSSALLRGLRNLSLLGLLLTCACIQVYPFGRPDIREVTIESSRALIDFNKVAVIDVRGFLVTESAGSLFSSYTTCVADLRERLERAAADRWVRAVVLRIDSPGGVVTAADIMREQVLAFRKETGKPVVACFLDVAASGGYYVAVASDRIVANPTSVTGSVGVIAQFHNVEALCRKLGIGTEVIKSGKMKDMGSAFRPMTDDERRTLQSLNDCFFKRFLAVVKDGRPKMPEPSLKLISDGRIVDAPTALKLGMVDRIGYLEDAIDEARGLAGVKTSRVILYRSGERANRNIYARASSAGAPPGDLRGLLREVLGEFAARSSPRFLYLWTPTP